MKKLNKETDMKKFTVTVCRTSYGFNDIEVNAETPEQAEELALENAGDYLYSEKGSEYTTAGITEKESKMTKFEIKQIVHEITIVEATDEETAMDMFMAGKTKISYEGKIPGGDDLHIREIK
jgi:hypothetical protein